MRINKTDKFLILCISILLLSNILYAADNETDTTNIENSQDNINVINVKSDTELRKSIENITSSDNKYNEINLKERNYTSRFTYKWNDTNIEEKIITINGNNAIINGKNSTSFAIIPRKVTLILNNLTLINMTHDIGGAITNSGTLIVNNCKFEGNTATEKTIFGGGAIFNEGTMIINNTEFINNTAYHSGSAIYSKSELIGNTSVIIDNCIFENNTALNESTISILGTDYFSINNSFFKNNEAMLSTVDNQRTNLTINNTCIINENTKNIITNTWICILENLKILNNDINEGIISNMNNLKMNKCTIENNSANYIISNNNYFEITNSDIINNSVKSSLVLNEANKTSYSSIIVYNSIFSNNNANESGIININPNSRSIVNETKFINNTSIKNKGIINDFFGEMSVINSKFFNNTSLNLFEGNLENFVNVKSNEYLGNNLNSYIIFNVTNNDGHVEIKGVLSTDKIYNTSINRGQISLYQNENILYTDNVTESIIHINSVYDTDSNPLLTLSYDGETHFKNQENIVNVLPKNEEYEIKITNNQKEYVYGEYIKYQITIENTGEMPVRNLKLKYLIPDDLILEEISYDIDEKNISTIPLLNSGEKIIIDINTSAREYGNLSLNFKVYDINNDSFVSIEKDIKFIKATISLYNMNSHAGDIINISARVNNYKKDSIEKILFKFQNKEVNNVEINFENSTIHILNYKLADNLMNKNYSIEILCDDNQVISFSNKTIVSISKLKTYSVINYNNSNNVLNISVNVFDEENRFVQSGSVIIKINGKSIKTLKVENGNVFLENYKINNNYRNSTYEISIVYSGNNKYFTDRNSSKVNLIKDETMVKLSYEIKDTILRITYSITCKNSDLIPDEGYIVFKVNGKSVTSKLEINQSTTFDYDISKIYEVNNITLSYYGSVNYLQNTCTVSIKD